MPVIPLPLLSGQSAPKDIAYVPLAQPVRLDGRIEPGEWPEEARRDGFVDADTALESDEHAEFWLASDGRHIYFAGRVRTDPRRLVDDEYRPNVSLQGNDLMRLALDPFGTAQSFSAFSVNPQGATSIALAGGRAAKTEWVGEFEASGRRTGTGWEFEARIPWQLMELPPEGVRDVRVQVTWYRSNRSNTYTYKYLAGSSANSPFWRRVPVPASSRARTVSALPYAIAGWREQGHAADFGIDMKSELGAGVTSVATANPDFRNVEAGILSIDPSFFERLAEDNRPFFAEGARYRKVGFDSRIFASQRIRSFDAGVNAYGRLGPRTEAALLSTVDFGNRQALVASVGHSLDDARSFDLAYAGNYERARSNHAANLGYYERRGEHLHYYTAQLTEDDERKSGHRVNLGVFRDSGGRDEGFELIEVSKGFFPRIGFAPETGYRGASFWHQRELQYSTGPLAELDLGLEGLYYDRVEGGGYRRRAEASIGGRTRAGIRVQAAAEYSRFGPYDDRGWGLGASYPAGSPYRQVYASYRNDSFRERNLQVYEFGGRYRPLKRLQVGLSNEFVSSGEGDGAQQVATWSWDLGKYESVGGRLVRRDSDLNWYLSYRMSGKRGVEWFLIVGDPNSRTFERRVLLKLVVPVTVRL